MLQAWIEGWHVPLFKEPVFTRMLLVFVLTLLLHGLATFLLRRWHRAAASTQSTLDDIVTYAAIKPVPLALWLLGLSYVVRIYARTQQWDEVLEIVTQARNIGLLFSVAWFFWRAIDEFRQVYLVRNTRTEVDVDQTTVDALSKLGHLVVFVITLITLLQTMGVSVSGLLAAGGIGGIAIGFAAKDILANFFGGLTIYLDRPFSVGDWIRSPDKDIEGTVEMISWRHTRIRRFNKNPIYVPNMLFTTITVENPSRMSHRRIREVIGIRFADLDKMAGIVSAVKHMLEQHPEIDATQTLIVNFVTFNSASLDFMVYAFTRTRIWVEYHAVKQDVLLKIADIILAHGAQLALPAQTLHMAPPLPVTAEQRSELLVR